VDLSTPENPVVAETPDETEAAYVPSGADYVSSRQFSDFPIRAETLWGVRDRGYVYATPVQNATIEAALAGKDLIVRAKTGTGKTAAFGVPVVDRAPASGGAPFGLVLAPTRELAIQIGEELAALAAHTGAAVAVLYGGVGLGGQEQELAQKPSIIVGTPGRILDHMRRKNLDLSQIRVAVLDEADEMLSMGFYEDVTGILDVTPNDRQIMLFSATISPDTQRIVQRYLRDPEQITLSTDLDQVGTIEHILYETRADTHKVRSLLYLLDVEDPTSAIIFCNTREDTATVATFLDRQGLDVQLLSGELSQARRTQVMKAVKAGEVRYLVSTDVASRGIDISDLSHVIHYSLPQDPAVYLHRSGRTGRIGKKGKAICLVGGPDLSTRRTLESVHGIRFDQKPLPDAEGAASLRVEHQAAQIKAALGTTVFEAYLPLVRALKQRPDGDMLLAASLRAFFQWDRQRRSRMSEVDSIRDLVEQRDAKFKERERRDGERRDGRDRKDRDRGESRDRDRDRERPRREAGRDGDRRERREPTPAAVELDLDALLLSDGPAVAPLAEAPAAALAADGEAKKKKRRRRKKKKAPDGSPMAADAAEGGDDGDDGDEADDAPAGADAGPLDDLDALLS